MKFRTFISEDFDEFDQGSPSTPGFSKQDITEMLEELDKSELQELGEKLMDIIYDEDFDFEDEEDLDEGPKKMKSTKRQMNRNKKVDKAGKRKLAKKRKQWYKRNKAKVKRYNKKAGKKRKQNKTVGGKRTTTHR